MRGRARLRRAVFPGSAAVALAALAFTAPLPLAAQETPRSGGSGSHSEAIEAPEPGDWVFPVGERSVYQATLGPVQIGEGELSVEEIERVDGTDAYRVALEMRGGPFFYKVDDRQVSWVAPEPIRSLRFEQHLRQGDYERDRRYRLDQEAGRYHRFDLDRETGEFRPVEEESGLPMPAAALDEISYLYFARTLPLEVGETYRFQRYFEEEGNPVYLEVLRRETLTVPAGRFDTIVVRPIIPTSGLFAEGGEAEVYLSDDERRVIVQLTSHSEVGELNLYLREYEAGDENGFIGN